MSTHFDDPVRMLIAIFALTALLVIPIAQAADQPASSKAQQTPQHTKVAPRKVVRQKMTQQVARQDVTSTTPPRLRLKLTARELDALIAKYQGHIDAARDAKLEEVVVSAPTELLPMRSEVNDAWSGLFAPMWAVVHPTQSWRLLLPIPAQ